MRFLVLFIILGLAACASPSDFEHGAPGKLGLPTKQLTPHNLTGLTSLTLENQLGSPIFARQDMNARIWQYRAHTCTLDLFLYQDGNSWTVAHWAMRGPKANDPNGCLAAITQKA